MSNDSDCQPVGNMLGGDSLLFCANSIAALRTRSQRPIAQADRPTHRECVCPLCQAQQMAARQGSIAREPVCTRRPCLRAAALACAVLLCRCQEAQRQVSRQEGCQNKREDNRL
ncbi:hypothetical protein AAFF_G00295700 [Aldrovandia affinis]|uniref:Uncharacterized protein n=1 Tax=Aldrovandia affinis TaxID=143900 RepID=A0AAD7SQ01_9TELE|nr:hypothetical protein AAFF_G00295700 [Aldrovandia affinis]